MKAGETVRFDDLAYGGYAIDSYAVFKRLRDEGVVPEGVRFQMSLPAPHSAIDGFLEDNTQWPELYAAYVEGIRREIAKALEVIPAGDLVIQWDAAWEFVDMAMGDRNYFAFWPKLSAEEKFQRHAEQLDELWQGIPDETLLGYHWCYGTWGGWPMTAMEDLDLCVRMSNEAKKRTGRRLDYVHMPVIRQPDEAFFAPLDDLDIGDTKVFLGIVHHTDGIEEFRRRRDLARKHLKELRDRERLRLRPRRARAPARDPRRPRPGRQGALTHRSAPAPQDAMPAAANDAVRITGSPAASEASRSTVATIAKSWSPSGSSMIWRTVQVRGSARRRRSIMSSSGRPRLRPRAHRLVLVPVGAERLLPRGRGHRRAPGRVGERGGGGLELRRARRSGRGRRAAPAGTSRCGP